MKKHLLHRIGLGCSLALSLVLFGSPANTASAQSVSPAGTWDFVISGAERGIAYITFDDAGFLTGYEAIAPSKPDDDPIETERTAGDQGRIISESDSSDGTTVTNILGFALLSGTWSYDINGRVVGVYTEGSENRSCTTNQEITAVVSNAIIDFKTNIVTITVTNYFTNEVVNCVTNPVTNGISFTAVVRPDRIVMKTTGANGKMTLKGIPAADGPDFSGSFYANAKKAGFKYTEFLTFVPSAEFFNGYEVFGQGPGYELIGIALISNQKKLGLVSVSSAENAPLTSAIGTVNANRGRASLSLVDLDSVRGNYQIFRVPAAP
jgi:hypothetical protein